PWLDSIGSCHVLVVGTSQVAAVASAGSNENAPSQSPAWRSIIPHARHFPLTLVHVRGCASSGINMIASSSSLYSYKWPKLLLMTSVPSSLQLIFSRYLSAN